MKTVLTKKKPEKKLLKFLKNKAGRGSSGRITVRHKGGGAKRLYRIVDFKQQKIDIPAEVISIEYDPYRTAYIMLLLYKDGEKRYSIAPFKIKVGDKIICSENAQVKPGNRLKIENVPVGTPVYNIELRPGKGAQIVRSAGVSAKVSGTEGKYSIVQMPSGEIRKILKECYVTVGEVSHPEWRYVDIKKAGNSRRRRIRPTVRGSAMNPVDHPHGGGEGRTSIGMKYPKTPTGKHALGVKTRGKKQSDKYILQRRKKKN